MADSDDDWEKEDVPVVLNKAATKNDEDIDLTVLELEAAAAAVPSLPSGPTEAQKLREEEKLANKVAYALQANETPEEKRRREKAQMEAADTELAADLMGSSNGGGSTSKSSGGGVSGIATVALKNKQDHVNFAITVATRMAGSTSFCVSAFYKELSHRIKGELSSTVMNEVISSLKESVEAVEEKKEAFAPKEKKLTKKQAKQKKQEHEDVFGGDYDEQDEYGEYGGMEDDYSFM